MYNFYRNGELVLENLDAEGVIDCIAGTDPRDTFKIVFHRIGDNGVMYHDLILEAMDLTGMLS